MPSYSYQGRSRDGKAANGTIDAQNSQLAAKELTIRGITPLSIREASGNANLGESFSGISLFQKRISLDELLIFTRQMHALTRSGIPIIRAMRGLADSSKNERLTEVLRDVSRKLESGVNLASSMQTHPEVFDDLYISMIHVGENTGQLEDAFQQLANAIEMQRETRKRIKQATRYPTMVLVALLVGLLIVNFFVIPKFAGVFAKFGADLPIFTKILVATSNFMIAYWWLIAIVAVLFYIAFRQWLKTPQGRLTWDRRKMQIPIIGPLFELIILSRFSRNFAMMLKAGMPITQALGVSAEAAENAYVSRHIRDMRNGIERGDSLLRVANATGMFTPLVLQMVAVGEETGQIDRLLIDVADFYDEEVDYGLKRLAESIEPILIFAMGIMVLILALGVFLPIWDLGRAAMGS